MTDGADDQELYHDIFGSVLDRSELTPYLLRNCGSYDISLARASLMMANRGFAVDNGKPAAGELERAAAYAAQATGYITEYLAPTVERHLADLSALGPAQAERWKQPLGEIRKVLGLFLPGDLAALIREDPRHLFLLSSSVKYPHLFRGRPGGPDPVPDEWRLAGCSTLKMCHLVKSLEEDSQDVYEWAQLGLWFESKGIPLGGLFDFPWDEEPESGIDECALRSFLKLRSFFRKLRSSISTDKETGGLMFNSGDGVFVRIVEVKARLKSPESMLAKLGKDASEEAYTIRDILAVTFLLRDRNDSLTLFHALQKQGVILQENTASASITQTLFDTSEDMEEAVRILMRNLARREGVLEEPDPEAVSRNARSFFASLRTNASANPHTSDDHRKFQCKLNYSVPVRMSGESGSQTRPSVTRPASVTRQHTVPIELRISDTESWERSEYRGEAHHDAYKCRQLLRLAHRLFSPLFSFPPELFGALREDQNLLYR